jgi:hypothetical protein
LEDRGEVALVIQSQDTNAVIPGATITLQLEYKDEFTEALTSIDITIAPVLDWSEIVYQTALIPDGRSEDRSALVVDVPEELPPGVYRITATGWRGSTEVVSKDWQAFVTPIPLRIQQLSLVPIRPVVNSQSLALAVLAVRDSRAFALAEAAAPPPARPARWARTSRESPATAEVFALMSWRDRRLAALSQAGHVEKFVDALVWILLPAWLFAQGASLPQIGWVVAAYGMVWGVAQLLTGPLSDRVGRFWPNVAGMWLCGLGVALIPLGAGPGAWAGAAALAGFGMALLYPNLSASVADISPPGWRGSAIGIYRFWRDLGYATGAVLVGAVAWVAGPEAAFLAVGLAMGLSGALLWWWGEETHPRLNPAD